MERGSPAVGQLLHSLYLPHGNRKEEQDYYYRHSRHSSLRMIQETKIQGTIQHGL